MAVLGALWLAKRVSLNLNFNFLNRISLLLTSIATQLSSRGWVDPVPDPILPEKFLGYRRESNPGPLGWQSDVLTTKPNTRSGLILGIPHKTGTPLCHSLHLIILIQGSSNRGPRAACGPRASFLLPGKDISQNTIRYEY